MRRAKQTEIIATHPLLKQALAMQYVYNDRKLVYQEDNLKLYHYTPKRAKPHATPVLVVFATVNRPEVLDLFPDTSFIRGLLDKGLNVYLLDWGYPTLTDQHISLGDYAFRYLHHAVEHIQQSTHQPSIHLIGICQGGFISLCYATQYPAHIKRLVLIATPIDFQTPDNIIFHLLDGIKVNDLVKLTGNISGSWLTQFFISLKPFALIGKKYLHFYDNLADEDKTNQFLRVEKWLHDAPDQTGQSFLEFIRYGYQQNRLVKGTLKLQGRSIHLNALTMPVLNIAGEQDHIIPKSSSLALKDHLPASRYTQKIFPAGHIGLFISNKAGSTLPRALFQWLIKS